MIAKFLYLVATVSRELAVLSDLLMEVRQLAVGFDVQSLRFRSLSSLVVVLLLQLNNLLLGLTCLSFAVCFGTLKLGDAAL